MPSSRRSLPALGFAALAGLAFSGLPGPARASGLRMTVERPQFTCERSGMSLSHVQYRPDRRGIATPALPCCDGQFGCAQFLSTRTVLQPRHRWHS